MRSGCCQKTKWQRTAVYIGGPERGGEEGWRSAGKRTTVTCHRMRKQTRLLGAPAAQLLPSSIGPYNSVWRHCLCHNAGLRRDQKQQQYSSSSRAAAELCGRGGREGLSASCVHVCCSAACAGVACMLPTGSLVTQQAHACGLSRSWMTASRLRGAVMGSACQARRLATDAVDVR